MSQQMTLLDMPDQLPVKTVKRKPTPTSQPATETPHDQALRFRRRSAEIRAQLRKERKIR